jgi:uncharacterized protein YvpB
MDAVGTVAARVMAPRSGHAPRLIALAAVVALAACGGVAGRPPMPPTTPLSSPTAPSTPGLASPPRRVTFTGVVAASTGTLVRFGPAIDMPALDIDPPGRKETFDGWIRRPDDPPVADAVTGRIEPWSRDWFHLADGRGWVQSATVRGMQPADLPPDAWTPPAAVPDPSAALMDITEDWQDQPVTCELASLKMALRFRGISTDETSLLALTGVDARPAETAADGTVLRWGNPNRSFVGDPAGRMSDFAGYGTYAGPIARAAAAEGATVLAAGTGVPASALYAAVLAGHPVVAWITSDYQRHRLRTWIAWDGTAVSYTMAEHAVLVIGVTPTMVIINDPWWGQLWRSRSTFEAAYATFDGMAVVIG